MCGRFTLEYSWAEIHKAFDLIPVSAAGRNDPPRYNIAPTQDVGFLHHRDGETIVEDGRWWLVPFWAKEIPKYPLFNARSETAHEKSSFREAFKSKRCLIPASGYYEWTKAEDGGKDPHLIHLPEKEPFLFAGLWAHNNILETWKQSLDVSQTSRINSHSRQGCDPTYTTNSSYRTNNENLCLGPLPSSCHLLHTISISTALIHFCYHDH